MEHSQLFLPNFHVENNVKTAQLWHGHEATPRQKRISGKPRTAHLTQADVLIQMLRDARAANRALDLPEIMAAGIAQHGARLNEIRRRNFQVENEMLRDSAGRIHSRYYLRFDPERDTQ